MFIMDYLSIIGEYSPDYGKNATWKLFRAYIDKHSQILIGEYPGDLVQAISRLKYQCAYMTFSCQITYNRLFQQVIHKGVESEIDYIERIENAKALFISVGNIYSEDQLMHNFLDNF